MDATRKPISAQYFTSLVITPAINVPNSMAKGAEDVYPRKAIIRSPVRVTITPNKTFPKSLKSPTK